MSYEDPSAAHSAGGFYNSMFQSTFLLFSLSYFLCMLILSCPSDYEMRGYKINVAMAEKSAPRAPPAFGHGYLPHPCALSLSYLDLSCLSCKFDLSCAK